LKIEGQVALDATGPLIDSISSKPISLRHGLNRVELDYHSPQKGNAQLRLSWSSRRFPKEPVPATVLVHDPDNPALRNRLEVRAGRRLFAEFRCVRCHKPSAAWSKRAMPELSADAPSLNDIGSRLKEDWIAKWLLEPRTRRPNTIMPSLLTS